MASTFGGTIKLNGESEYRRAVKDITAQLKTYKEEIKKVSAEFYKEDEQEKKLTETNKTLNNSIEKQKEKINLLTSAYEKNKKELGENDSKTQGWKQQLLKAQTELHNMEKNVAKNEETLEKLKKEQDENTDSVKKFGEAEEKAGKKAITFGDLIKSHLISDAIMSGVRQLAGFMKDLAVDTINTGAEFGSAMGEVAAVMGMTTEDINGGSEAFERLEEAAINAGATTKYSCTEAANALNELASAGYDADSAIEMLPTVLGLAQAGGMELANATAIVTESINAFGLAVADADKLTNQMAQTANLTNAGVNDLGEAYATIGGTAKTLKGGISELNTALGILGNAGIKGAEGGTHLRNVIMSLQSPTDKASDALDTLGVSVYDSRGNMRELNDILTDLNNSMSGMTTEEKQNIINSIFNKTDIAAVNTLLSHSGDEWETLTAQIEDSEGAMQRMADVMNDNLKGDLTSLSSALEAFKVSLFDNVDGPIRSVVQNVRDSVSNLTTALTSSGIDGFVKQLGVECQKWFDSIVDLIKNIGEKLPEMVPLGIKAVLNFVQGAISNIPALIKAGISLIRGLVQGVINSIPLLIEQAPKIVNDFWDTFDECALDLISAGASIIWNLITGIIENIPNLIANAGEIVSAIVNTIVHINMIKIGSNLMKSLANGIKSVFGTIKNMASSIANDGIKKVFGNFSLKSIGKNIMNTLKSGVSSMSGSIKSSVSSIAKNIKNAFSNFSLYSIGKNLVQGLWNGINSVKSWILSKIKGFSNSILSGIKSFFGIHSPSTVFRDEVGTYLAQGLGVGFTDEMENVSKEIQNSIPTSYDLDLQTNLKNQGLGENIKSSLVGQGLDFSSLNLKFDTLISLFDSKFNEMIEAIRNMKIVLEDGTLIGKIANGVDVELGTISRLKARGI